MNGKEDINVRSVIKRMGKEAASGAFLAPALSATRNCTAWGACLERCPYELPIPDLIHENLEWVDRGMR